MPNGLLLLNRLGDILHFHGFLRSVPALGALDHRVTTLHTCSCCRASLQPSLNGAAHAFDGVCVHGMIASYCYSTITRLKLPPGEEHCLRRTCHDGESIKSGNCGFEKVLSRGRLPFMGRAAALLLWGRVQEQKSCIGVCLVPLCFLKVGVCASITSLLDLMMPVESCCHGWRFRRRFVLRFSFISLYDLNFCSMQFAMKMRRAITSPKHIYHNTTVLFISYSNAFA